MYKISQDSKKIEPLERRTFSSLDLRERGDLQEWIAKRPDALGEDLLIIQKEFSGWPETKERLDLLALDKKGRLVVIENKLDDSGRDVTWQALKYASYCSSLSKAKITEIYQKYLDATKPGAKAEERISEFMDEDFEEITLNKDVSQRIILIAAKFRKEVTSTVLWLRNFKIRLQCFQVTPYAMGKEFLLDIERIIPVPDAAQYMIGMTERRQEQFASSLKSREHGFVRREFWAQLIQAMNSTQSNLFQKISPSSSNWISAASGIVRGAGFYFVAVKDCVRVQLYIDRRDRTENKSVFDQLKLQKDAIEGEFGSSLEWQRLDEKRACRIKAEKSGNVLDRDQWPDMIKLMADTMCRLEQAMKKPLEQVEKELKSGATKQADDS